jgi:hypothetical protein
MTNNKNDFEKSVRKNSLVFFCRKRNRTYFTKYFASILLAAIIAKREGVLGVEMLCDKKTPGILKDYFRLLADCYEFNFYADALYRGEHVKTGNKYLNQIFEKIYKKINKSKNEFDQFIYLFCLEVVEKIRNPDIEIQDLYDCMLRVIPEAFSDYREYLRSIVIAAGETCGWNFLFLSEKSKELLFFKRFNNYDWFKCYLSYS